MKLFSVHYYYFKLTMGSLFSKSPTDKNSAKMNDSLTKNGEQPIMIQNKTLSTMSAVHQR